MLAYNVVVKGGEEAVGNSPLKWSCAARSRRVPCTQSAGLGRYQWLFFDYSFFSILFHSSSKITIFQ